MEERLNIVFTIDKDFIMPFTVALTSIMETNQENINRVFLIHSIIDDQILQKSLTYFRTKYKLNVELIYIDDAQFTGLPTLSFISVASYFRLILSELVPSDIDRILYLDCDLVVTGDLSKLTTENFYNNYLCAVDQEHHISMFDRFNNTNFKGNKYFNAGVMLINLKKWRENNISNILLQNANKYIELLEFLDQDVLNITFCDKWKELDYKYNAWKHSNKSIEKVGMEVNDLSIIHYIGPTKPWNYQCKHLYKNHYFKYHKLTPFKKNKYIDFSIYSLLKKIIPIKAKSYLKAN